LFDCIHPIVHWLPNKTFAWWQSCEGFVNMAIDNLTLSNVVGILKTLLFEQIFK
jgi:hypothetical protein